MLRSDAVMAIVDRHGVRHDRVRFSTPLHRRLHGVALDSGKAEVVARHVAACFGGLSREVRKQLEAHVERCIHFFGVNPTNGRKLLAKYPGDAVERFLAGVRRDLLARSRPPSAVGEDTIVILHSASGGAHISTAAVLHHELSQRAPCINVNESALHRDDATDAVLGVPFNVLYTRFFQKAGQRSCLLAARELAAAVNEFIPSRVLDEVRAAVGEARVIVATSDWRHEAALIAEADKRVVFQICDFGEGFDNTRDLIALAEEYDLDGLEFMVPASDDTVETKHRHRTAYPVDAAWEEAANGTAGTEARARLHLRGDSHVLTMMAGLNGQSGILEGRIAQLVAGCASALARGETLAPIDIAVVCGHNTVLGESLTAVFADACERARATLSDIQMAQLRDNVHLHPLGYLGQRDLAALCAASALVVSKPGGATSAELLAARVPSPLLHWDATYVWEQRNIAELQNRLGAILLDTNVDLWNELCGRMSGSSRPTKPPPSAIKSSEHVLNVYWARLS
jgi:hypothetical protein